MADETVTTDSSNVIVSEPKKLMTLDEYEERTAHLGENATSLLKAVANNQTQVNAITTQATQLATYASNVAEQASLSFSKKAWSDTATSGTPITATELNRLETAIYNLTTAVNNLQDSVTQGCKRIFCGSIVRTIESDVYHTRAHLWNASECNSAFGRQFRASTDCCICMNGDYAAINWVKAMYTYYTGSEQCLYCRLYDGSVSAPIRLNYVICFNH